MHTNKSVFPVGRVHTRWIQARLVSAVFQMCRAWDFKKMQGEGVG